ncbi:hypothetical protein OH540_24205 [Streptomyces sp. BPPL-273]|uniref:hypothetical protein n=1 Tax=Streptomyces sp. BPPL-273 TaxID=2987533 RepID=UPI0024AF8EAE|nr:hypothetical protein [Streptomyces sp. BPPL-273]WHM32975.1 hypothetical protein OH540_24205 [Streptomyces sp. BPPL-273]
MAEAKGSKWLTDINAESPLELVMRGHLWIESRLIDLLHDIVPFPDRIDFDRFTFPQKVALVAAHGGLEGDDVAAYLKLNSMRNKVAHRLDAALSSEDEVALINCLSASLRHSSMVDDPSVSSKSWPYSLRHIMAAMIIRLEHRHKELLRAREDQRALMAEVRRVTHELRTEREQREVARSATSKATASEVSGQT